jgi:endonuclease YncB( thermonuclease family)
MSVAEHAPFLEILPKAGAHRHRRALGPGSTAWLTSLVLVLWMGAVALSAHAAARVLPGQVTRVVDGDTLWFQPSEPGEPLVAVRLRGIDAPESCQPWGRQGTLALREQVLGRPATLLIHGQDDYRRTLGTLSVGGVDLNAALVAHGHAWAWRDSKGHSPYLQQESEARAAGRGAHANPAAEAPWDFRRRHGRCRR